MKAKNSELKPEGKRNLRRNARKGEGSKSGQVKSAKLASELEHYRARLADNEERLGTGVASDGTPLTAIQRANLEQIIARQRARLIELSI
jgi:hypothetical protein